MSDLLQKLGRNAQKGSKPRCHWLTHGTPNAIAARLTKLIDPWGNVSASDAWMPEGFEQTDEAELHKAVRLLTAAGHCEQIRDWWFKIVRGEQTAPSFDIASTCTAGSKRGILLVEAKAHDLELIDEEKGKSIKQEPSTGQRTNHDHIGEAISNANKPFADSTGHPWSLSRDDRYQMSNRFASACKLTELGYPVILVYLGFVNAEDMRLGKRQPFANHAE